MSPKTVRAINDALGDLSLDDRMIALICSIMMRKSEPAAAVVTMLATIEILTGESSPAEQIALSELTRDSADRMERRKRTVSIV
jgi:hypothetical protein